MTTIPNTRHNPHASDIAVQDALPLVGSVSRTDGQTVLNTVDADLAKLFENDNIFLAGGGTMTFSGTALSMTEALVLHLNSKVAGGSPTIISLAATTRTLSANGRMLYAVIDRTGGTATVTDDAASLPAVVAANVEVVLIAKRIDTGGGTKRLYFRNGVVMTESESREFWFSGLSNPMDSAGDLIKGGSGGTAVKLDHPGTANYVVASASGPDTIFKQIDDPTFFTIGAAASATDIGIATTAAQVFAGEKTFNDVAYPKRGTVTTDVSSASYTIASGTTLFHPKLTLASGHTYTVTGTLVTLDLASTGGDITGAGDIIGLD